MIRTRAYTPSRCFFPAATCLAALVVLSGCGPDRPQTIPVSGKLTFRGGPPPAPGALYFTSDDPAEGFSRRPASADFNAEGRFTVKSWEAGDGLVPGRYQVTVECWEVPPNMDGQPVKSYVPEKYQSSLTTDLEVEVASADGSQELELDVH